MRVSLGIVLGLFAGTQTFAATMIEGVNKLGEERPEKILIEGTNAKMETGMSGGQYMLLKLDEQKMYMVNPKQKQVLDVLKGQDQMPKMGNAPKPPEAKYELVDKGNGPEIAGYSTKHYQVMANGNLCSNEYLSQDALKVEHLQGFVNAMKEMNASRQKANRNIPFAGTDPCTNLQTSIIEKLASKGFSMRSADADGKIRREVSSIKTGVAVNPGTFDIPEGYEVTSPFDMLKKVMEGMSQGAQPPGDAPATDSATQQQLRQQLLQKLQEAQQQKGQN